MNKLIRFALPSLALAAMTLGGCTTTRVAHNYNGLTTGDGIPSAHLNTSKIAIHLLMADDVGILGNASLDSTLDDFTAAAKKENATKVHIAQSDVTKYWWILPPFSFILTPVTSNMAGDAIR